jgi:radical SAM superfamily enzyme YgiQ (UPF0313 family)
MNFLLIKPYWPYPYSRGEYTYNRIWPPLCLANCAAILEGQGQEVQILDAHAQRIKPNRINKFIKGFDKIFVTSSTLDRWQCPNVHIEHFLETVRNIRSLTQEVYIIGYHGTAEPEKMLDLTQARAVIRGEPEITVAELCQGKDLFSIKGISFLHKGAVVSNPQREPLDLKTLPLPAFHLLNFNKYFYEIMGNRFCVFELSRGCKFNCAFCNKHMYGQNVRFKTENQIVAEITAAIEKYHIKNAYFMDLDFLYDAAIVETVCTHIIKKGYKINWTCQTRPDHLNKGIAQLMRQAGCRLIHMGVETGVQELLDNLKKAISIEKIENAFQICRELGMGTLAFFMLGLPGETGSQQKETFEFLRKIRPDFVSFHKLVYYHECAVYQDSPLKDKELNTFMSKALIKYYFNPAYLWKLSPASLFSLVRLFWGRMKTLK